MNNTYPIGTPLTFVWRFLTPDKEPLIFDPARHTFRLRYYAGRGTKDVTSFMINADGDAITWSLPAEEEFFAGSYSLILDVFLGGRYIGHIHYKDAFALRRPGCDIVNARQFEDGATIHLVSVGEFYHFAPDDVRLTAIENEMTELHDTFIETIEKYRPIIINGDVTNAPDEEDLTADENNFLKLKDRNNTRGKGYKYLRQNKTFAEQVNSANYIYEVRYDLDLEGGTVAIPAGCTFKYAGGQIKNGTLVGNGTIIDVPADVLFSDVTLQGTWKKPLDTDEEDITRGANDVLQFKDRSAGDGMGYVILRKNKSFAEQVTATNTIYVIRYDFTLDEDVTIPANCVLEFDGGSISGNGTGKNTITLNGALINADNTVFHNIIITPEEKLTLHARWFDATSDNILLTMLINAVYRNSRLIIDRNFSITEPISSGVGLNGLLNTTIESPKFYDSVYSINIDYLPSNNISPIKLYVQECVLKNIVIKDNNVASGAVNGDTALLELLPQYLWGAEGDTDIDGCLFRNNRCTNHLKVVGRGYRIMNCGFSGAGHINEGVIRCVGKTNNEGSSEQPWDYPDVSMRRLTIRNNTCHSNNGFLVDISQDPNNVDTAFLNVSISNNTCDNGCRIIKTSSKIRGLNICNNTFLCVQASVEESLKQVIDVVICYFNGNIDGLNFTNNIVNINPHILFRNAEATLYFSDNYEFNNVNISDNIVNSNKFGFLVFAPKPNINGLNIKNNIIGKDAFVNGSWMSGARCILFCSIATGETGNIKNLVISDNTSSTEYAETIHAITGIGNLNLKNALIFGNMFTDNAIDGLTVLKTNVILQSDIVNAI